MTVSDTMRTFVVAAALAILPQVAAAQQQTPPATMMGPGGMGRSIIEPGMMAPGGFGAMGPGMHSGTGPGMMMRYGPVAEGRLAYLKAELEITDAQTSAWDGYVKVVKSRIDAMQAMHASMSKAMHGGTALARLHARISGAQTMVASLEALKLRFRPLLNPLHVGKSGH